MGKHVTYRCGIHLSACHGLMLIFSHKSVVCSHTQTQGPDLNKKDVLYVLIRIFQAFSIYTGPRSSFSDDVTRFRIVKAPCQN